MAEEFPLAWEDLLKSVPEAGSKQRRLDSQDGRMPGVLRLNLALSRLLA